MAVLSTTVLLPCRCRFGFFCGAALQYLKNTGKQVRAEREGRRGNE